MASDIHFTKKGIIHRNITYTCIVSVHQALSGPEYEAITFLNIFQLIALLMVEITVEHVLLCFVLFFRINVIKLVMQ